MITRITVALAAVMLAVTVAQGATIWGHCHLEGQENEGLTRVQLAGIVPRETTTDCEGGYEFSLILPGWHTLTYSHPGFYSETRDVYVDALGGQLPTVTLESKVICDPADWCYYPYAIPGADPLFTFPWVEGEHKPTSSYRKEWWYVNFHLTVADDPDRQYAGFIAFFKPMYVGGPGLVLQSVIDLQSGTPYYQNSELPMLFSVSELELDVSAGGNSLRYVDCDGVRLPFEYHLYSGWLDGGVVAIELDMKSLKPPIAVGGDGYVDFGDVGFSYYYSSPRLDVQGTLFLPGFSSVKEVEGTAWLDHQWGDYETGPVTWEWISMHLGGGREIMVFDVWVNGVRLDNLGGLNYYDGSCSLEVLNDYELTPLDTFVDPVTRKEFATQWELTAQGARQIDLTITADYENQIMRIGENEFLDTCFWEGACSVVGTIGGPGERTALVTGTAFAELTHTYQEPTPHSKKKPPLTPR